MVWKWIMHAWSLSYGKENYQWSVCVESNYTSSLLVTVVLEMFALIGGLENVKSVSLLFLLLLPHHLSKNSWQKEKAASLGSICRAASGFNTPTSSTRGGKKSSLNHTSNTNTNYQQAYRYILFFSRNSLSFSWFKLNLILLFNHFRDQ